jgi:glutamate--cysteine ligase
MDANDCRHLVAGLFPPAHGPRSTRAAVEHELLVSDAVSGDPVEPERVRAAVEGLACASYVGFEPGGQLELSLPSATSPASLARSVARDLAAVRAACGAAGIDLTASPVDARPAVPLRLTSPRYVAMQRRFDEVGPAGRVMMRRTASTQVCLDWWPGRAGLDQWRLLNLAAPFLAAAFARATGPGSRLATWLTVDPTRTAFDGRLLRGEDPVAAYASFATSAVPIVSTPVEHLTTLFPPVRPRRRYLEVRFPDVQHDDRIGALVSVLATLAHDDGLRAEALCRLVGEERHLEQHWYDAAHGRGAVADRGRELVALTARATTRSAA